MAEDDILRRWMGFELHKLNEANVLGPRPLADLLAMRGSGASSGPSLATRAGTHTFDRDALQRLAADVPILLRHQLRVPITFYTPHDTPGEAYLEDAAAIEAAQALGWSPTTPRGNRLWMGWAAAMRVADRYPTCVQFTAL